jgi:hypothetical protein
MHLPRLFVNDSAATADLHSLTFVPLVRRHELDAAVAVPVVVPVHKRRHPLAGLFEVGAFYWTVLAPDIVNSGRAEQGSDSV